MKIDHFENGIALDVMMVEVWKAMISHHKDGRLSLDATDGHGVLVTLLHVPGAA